MSDKKSARLILEDGTTFTGYSFGAETATTGEVVFNTAMTGYPESLTDPSYSGQILVSTYPLVGNYGVPQKESEYGLLKFFESDRIHVKGLVISDYSFEYSHWNAGESLGEWLRENGVPGIWGIDTRQLTKIIRERGVMLGKIVVEGSAEPAAFDDPNLRNLAAEVSTPQVETYGDGPMKIVLVDCGSICACIGHATGRRPDITLGKPDPNMLSGILSRHGLKPDQIAMVGDRIYTDVAMAHNAKAMGVLVLSGETTLDVADKADPQPHITADSIEVLGRLIREAHGK